MKMLAIIANYRELPDNLSRTVAAIRAQGVDVRVIDDTPQMGCGWRRDQGIVEAQGYDAVFLCDGHMDFTPDYFNTLKKELTKTPESLLVTRMQSLTHEWQPIAGHYAGAYIRLFDSWDVGQQIPIAAKWRTKDLGNGYIGAVMGACYAMTRQAYMDAGRPLAILRAWGGDEEMLSIAFWLRGGGVRLVDGLVRHIYAAPRQGGRMDTPETVAKVWGNRLAMIRALPIPQAEAVELESWVRNTAHWTHYGQAVALELPGRGKDIERTRKALENAPNGWEMYKLQWVEQSEKVTEEAEMKRGRGRPKKQEVKQQVKVAEPPKGRANYSAGENRRTCQKCGSAASTVDSMRRTGKMVIRYRICGNCGQRRVTQEILATT